MQRREAKALREESPRLDCLHQQVRVVGHVLANLGARAALWSAALWTNAQSDPPRAWPHRGRCSLCNGTACTGLPTLSWAKLTWHGLGQRGGCHGNTHAVLTALAGPALFCLLFAMPVSQLPRRPCSTDLSPTPPSGQGIGLHMRTAGSLPPLAFPSLPSLSGTLPIEASTHTACANLCRHSLFLVAGCAESPCLDRERRQVHLRWHVPAVLGGAAASATSWTRHATCMEVD